MNCKATLLVCLAFVVCINANFFPVPGGLFMHRSCVHEVESGATVKKMDGLFYVDGIPLPRCDHPIYHRSAMVNASANGWQTYTSYNQVNNQTFLTFNGYFSVPAAPLSWGVFPASAIVYIFTGLQNDNWVPTSSSPSGAPAQFEIIQPVLQYGAGSENGGGLYWGVASWYVTVDAGAVYSKELKVSPGDNIYGTMESTGPTTWVINSVIPSGENTTITIDRNRLVNNPWAYNTLEVYNIKDCSWLPPSTTTSEFTQLLLEDANGPVTPQWTVFTEPNGNPCSSLFTVNDPTSVTLQCQGATQ